MIICKFFLYLLKYMFFIGFFVLLVFLCYLVNVYKVLIENEIYKFLLDLCNLMIFKVYNFFLKFIYFCYY